MSKKNTNAKGSVRGAQTFHSGSPKSVKVVRSASTGKFIAKRYAKAISYIVTSEEKGTDLMICSSKL